MTHLAVEAGAARERLGTIGWGLVLLLVGLVALPGGPGEDGAVVVVGAMMLTRSGVPIARGRPFDVLTAALGGTALAGGDRSRLSRGMPLAAARPGAPEWVPLGHAR